MSLVKYGKRAAKHYPALRKRARVYVPAVRQLASDVMYLKGLVNSEPNYITLQATNNFDYNGVILSCSTCSQGDAAGQRQGNRILPRYVSIKGIFGMSSTGTAAEASYRMLVFQWWGESSFGVPSVQPNEIFGGNIGTQYAPYSHLKPEVTGSKGDRARRIQILHSKLITVNPNNNRWCPIDLNIELNGGKAPKQHIEYYQGGTEPVSGGIYILLVADNAVLADNRYTIESKVTFYDN